MTEFWKSTPKKFCEACKCWYSDNKISSENHMKGAIHKKNMERFIQNMEKKSKDKKIADYNSRSDLIKIEESALRSFKKDAMKNPLLMAQYDMKIKELETKKAAFIAESQKSTPIKVIPNEIKDSKKREYVHPSRETATISFDKPIYTPSLKNIKTKNEKDEQIEIVERTIETPLNMELNNFDKNKNNDMTEKLQFKKRKNM